MKSKLIFLSLLLYCSSYGALFCKSSANIACARPVAQPLADQDDDDEPAMRQEKERKTPPKLAVPAYVTYWTHDALGYHPSMMFTMENISDVNLLGEVIQLQAHFRLLSEGILTVYRWQTRLDSIGNKQQTNTEAHGKRPFELPIDPAEWPQIECKVMCKIGDVSSEESQNLVVARIQAVAMTDDDARAQLNSQLGNNRLAKAKMEQGKKKFEAEHPHSALNSHDSHANLPKYLKAPSPRNGSESSKGHSLDPDAGGNAVTTNLNTGSHYASHTPAAIVVEKPLIAVANTLSSAQGTSTRTGAFNQTNQTHLTSAAAQPIISWPSSQSGSAGGGSGSGSGGGGGGLEYVLKGNLPGLGDDFYQFEKTMGMPVQTDVKDRNWIWASYKKHPQVKIVAGSKGRTGKADVVVCSIDNAGALSDSQFISLTRALTGKFKSEKASATEHSVRYTGDGRIELVNLTTQSCRALYFKNADPSGQISAVVAVSRLPGSLSELLKEEGHKSDLLHFALHALGEESGQ